MDDRVAELERECAELRRRLAAAERTSSNDAAAFLESLLGAVPAFIIRTDADMRIIYLNRVQPGLQMEEVIGRDLDDFFHPDSIAPARACIDRVLATGQPGAYEATSLGPNGTPAQYETFVTPLADRTGRMGVCLVSVDVTRIHLRDVALRRSEEELRVAVEATGIGLWSWTPSTNDVHWYPRTHEVLGRANAVDLARYIDEVVHPGDRELLRANTAASIAGGPFSGPIHRVIRDDGEVRWILSRGHTELDAEGRPARVIGGSLDVTQQRELEEQLRHVQRLDAVGHLTAGIAHNFNNMLTVVMGTLEVLAKRLAGDNRRLVDAALESALRGAEMVRQLMMFAGQRAQPDRRPCDVGAVVTQVITMCRNTFDRHIALTLVVADDLPAIRCAAHEIEQVLMNVLVNARDAVTGRADARISVQVTTVPDPTRSENRMVKIAITDNGIGMDETLIVRAFDPFFTTKEVGRGTGLGLTTSYAIVRELDGTMTCTSTPGQGTTLVVMLPASSPAQVAVPVQAPPPPARRRVLLVDDDASVGSRELAARERGLRGRGRRDRRGRARAPRHRPGPRPRPPRSLDVWRSG